MVHKEVKKVGEHRACVELNEKQKLFYDASAGYWYLQIQTSQNSVSTVILREDVLDKLYNVAWGESI